MNSAVRSWVADVEALTMPSTVVYCDGSKAERERLIAECLANGELIELNQQKLPGCYLHRSAPHDVARTEHLTFVSTTEEDDAGPTNNWMAPDAAREKLMPLFRGSMKGRTMYVVPFLMGPPGSPYSKVGVEITDSRYVVLNMRIMTRIGQPAARPPGRLRRLHPLSPFARRPQSGPAFHRALSRRERRVVDRVWLWRQRPPRQEVSRAATRQLSGEPRGLARRAHAHRRVQIPGWSGALHRRRLSFGVRQDQHGHARAARLDARLENMDRRRRHRLDSSGLGRSAVGSESRGRIFRRAAWARAAVRTRRPST